MQKFFKYGLFFLLIAALSPLEMKAEEGSCPKCVLIRKANAEKAKDQSWVFYEDWLETDEGKAYKEENEVVFDEDDKSNSKE